MILYWLMEYVVGVVKT